MLFTVPLIYEVGEAITSHHRTSFKSLHKLSNDVSLSRFSGGPVRFLVHAGNLFVTR